MRSFIIPPIQRSTNARSLILDHSLSKPQSNLRLIRPLPRRQRNPPLLPHPTIRLTILPHRSLRSLLHHLALPIPTPRARRRRIAALPILLLPLHVPKTLLHARRRRRRRMARAEVRGVGVVGVAGGGAGEDAVVVVEAGLAARGGGVGRGGGGALDVVFEADEDVAVGRVVEVFGFFLVDCFFEHGLRGVSE